MGTAQLERSDLASPGAKFSQGALSLQRFKNSKRYRDELRLLAATPIPANSSEMEIRRARLLRVEAQTELDELRSGESASVFSGVIRFARPKPD